MSSSDDETHVALCSGGTHSVGATHAAMTFGPAEEVVFLDTRTAPPEEPNAIRDTVEWLRDMLAEPVLRDGDRLLEPFCGSGPGAAVAAARGLDYWGCDVDADAVERTRARLRQPGLGHYAAADGGGSE